MEDALRTGAGAPDLKLIETLGWDGQSFPRLGGHLARLAASAARLGWGCDVVHVRDALHSAVGDAALRVRLTLDGRGQIVVTTSSMPAPAGVWRVGLAALPLWSGDPWLSVKSTRRGSYDAARAALQAGLDEVIFQNERGEVCDGTITTVYYDRGAGLRTPPLRCGLLPSVLRAQLLHDHHCHEEVLMADDLPAVALWVGNALRGIIPAVWVAGDATAGQTFAGQPA